MSGLRAGQVAEIVVPHGAGNRRGSGYLVRPGIVLTAAHVVAGADHARVRFDAGRPGEYSGDAEVRWRHAGVDVAVLGVPSRDGPRTGRAHFGRVPEEDLLLRCSAAGFPYFKVRQGRDGSRYREYEHVHATCSVFANRREGTLDLRVARSDHATAKGGSVSPWEGMSGAAVFSDGRIVGIVSRHHLGDGPGRLGASRVDRWAETLSADERGRLEELLGRRLTLDALEAVREQARPPSSYTPDGQLDHYLAAAERYAGTHPYDDVSFGLTPPLADVYLRRCVKRRLVEHPQGGEESEGAGPQGSRERLSARLFEEVSAEEVFTGEEPCVVVAGAGGGKTSLLRRCLALGIEARRRGEADDVSVPVLVPAASLAGRPLAEALAAAATAELAPHGLLETLSPALFSRGPGPGARWTVLVDGLDEIADVGVRRTVLRGLAALGEGGPAGPFRFVVATRPLADEELESFTLHYVLKPFQDHDVRELALVWFRYLGLPDPQGAADRFLAVLARADLAEMASSPLMATMLCRLYAAGPDGTLPSSRGAVYRSYIDLLDSGRSPAGLVRVRTQTRAALQGRGDQALKAVERTLDHLPALIAQVADVLHGDNRLSAVDVLETLPAVERPCAVPPREWRAFLEAALRGSGLLTAGAGRLEFWHQTLLEFLAAQHALADAHALGPALKRVFEFDVPEGQSWRVEYGIRIPSEYLSYIAFLLDAASESGDQRATRQISVRLRRLVDGGYPLRACKFIAQLARFGAALPPQVVDAVVDTAVRLLTGTPTNYEYEDHAEMVDVVLGVGHPDAIEICADLVKDPRLDDRAAMWAARALPRAGGARGVELCVRLASDPGLPGAVRVRGARALAGWKPHGADLCAALGQDTGLDDETRVRALRALARLGDPRAADLCVDLCAQRALSPKHRTWMAILLVALDDARGADQYALLAGDARLDLSRRRRLITTLSLLPFPRAAGFCAGLAGDSSRSGAVRVAAAEALLSRCPDGRAVAVATALATDTRLRHGHRVAAVRALALRSPRHGAPLCAELAVDESLDPHARAALWQLLAELRSDDATP
ncbi:trypsin-like peptidase domain-containing protein [Streptomyces sp. RK9]|uniref:trypsin-like peptidase domain-containing protein n=1 Tax=Streptomyces sp. RK9 TaxID=3239284 RepID=UPI00386969BA